MARLKGNNTVDRKIKNCVPKRRAFFVGFFTHRLPRSYIASMNPLELLARLIQCEAGGEGVRGMQAVASVIMNRVNQSQGEYGRYNSIPDVVYAPRQFECASNQQQSIWNMSPDATHYAIAEWAINGGRLPGLEDALWFYNPYSVNCRSSFPNQNGYLQTRIGDHCFYSPRDSYFST